MSAVRSAPDRACRLLTDQEKAVLGYSAGGRTQAETAAVLGVSPYTVKNQLAMIYKKRGARHIGEAVACLITLYGPEAVIWSDAAPVHGTIVNHQARERRRRERQSGG